MLMKILNNIGIRLSSLWTPYSHDMIQIINLHISSSPLFTGAVTIWYISFMIAKIPMFDSFKDSASYQMELKALWKSMKNVYICHSGGCCIYNTCFSEYLWLVGWVYAATSSRGQEDWCHDRSTGSHRQRTVETSIGENPEPSQGSSRVTEEILRSGHFSGNPLYW